MLIGQYSSKLTEGSRISIPKKFREELGEGMIISKWYEGSLVLVSKLYWEGLVKRLTGETRIITSPVRDIDRFIYGSAFEVDLDSQGRFVLPESLRAYANIVSEISFIGLGDRIEIWGAEKWLELERGAEEKSSLAIEKIAKK
ncbi:hypothetical protein A2715_05240 [Candidatus Woesebacteria bacterium RIFCSPHIGHO2_01_FULL_39_32]|uniref:Transcriptional regulator MraZ n=1 Tax=Candidatus Woesebacteria bacterium RIFCSPLOWO2_01_FULL_39_25 TaxID=1802521 RepID=A0A1F8BLL2_9BACT|nr:MAG: hypothetical protein A2124_05380 [Candidatus Woesebacteria bacterium GWB1_37_5]OGM25423.1 MAG: hypothetical protein A2715_05240 [Candidatus Woesebacteria bacterium RIFCSPHIGHO2_01_FULL_39_32]OGM38528.1 MAG: hypothetical protein A3F01_04200 [Candidatus Woesebacteria bacterium RIFCSPHIGHO2_12_FULL_38_11]OGM64954.1 MAG: hypothetical protein A2893_04850 [Candidatus Woesebacteria bacterium RIFCSPLOWO2_01_FULL_39_25]